MNFSLTVLGSNSALPTSNRFPSAQVLTVNDHHFLIDCGEGTQIQIRRNRIRFGRLDHIFISHAHGDHIFGLPGLLATLGLLGRKAPLHIFCPESIADFIACNSPYIGQLDFPLEFHHLNPHQKELVLANKTIRVWSFPLKHRIPTCGFLFMENDYYRAMRKEKIEELQIPVKEIFTIKMGADYITPNGERIPNRELTFPPYKARSYAYCSDTAYDETIATYIEGVDLLYHESTFTDNLKDRAHSTLHSTASEAAQIAEKARAGKLLLGHFSSRYKDTTPFLNEARGIFPNSEAINDNDVFHVALSRLPE